MEVLMDKNRKEKHLDGKAASLSKEGEGQEVKPKSFSG